MLRKVLLALLLALGPLSAFAATMYISDELTVPLRRGPSNGHKIINAALPSGLSLEVISEDAAAGFTQVRTPNGVEGWVPTQYLTGQPVAKDRLAAANKRVEALEAQLKSIKENYQDVRGARTEIEGKANDLAKENQKLQADLAEIRRVSATAITQFEENKQLKADNARLTTQVTELTGQVQRLNRSEWTRGLMLGGGLVLAGLVLGAVIKSRPKRSNWA